MFTKRGFYLAGKYHTQEEIEAMKERAKIRITFAEEGNFRFVVFGKRGKGTYKLNNGNIDIIREDNIELNSVYEEKLEQELLNFLKS